LTDSPDAVRQFTATTNAAVAQARLVAKDAVSQIDAGTYGCEAWCRSLVKLFDIVARGSATHFKTAVSHGCCPTTPTHEWQCGMQPSDPISVPADNYLRHLSVQVPFTRVGGQESIPNDKIGFQPTDLPAGATTFSVYLLDAQYMGASYTGTVRLTTITSNLAPASFVDRVVTVEL
jgi:hypothetical protein